MEKHFDVLVVGELNVDLILDKIDKFPELGKEIIAEGMTMTLGSSSAIFASNLSTLGTTVRFVGQVGQDSFGDKVISSLRARGVDTDHIFRSSKYATGATVVLNYGEDRAMVTYPGAMKELTIQSIPDIDFQTCRHLHLSSIFLQPGLTSDLTELFAKAKSRGLTTSIDPQWDPSEQWDIALQDLLPHVDLFMPNIRELYALTRMNDLQAALNELTTFSNVVVVKNGRQGASLWDGNSLIHQAPFLNNDVADSIGAGDSFNSGFLHKFLQKRPLPECLEFGALTGAINTTRAGGIAAFENLDLVKTIAQSSFNYTLI
jgi:sugar/nucleoside kinase (ribokinase family)